MRVRRRKKVLCDGSSLADAADEDLLGLVGFALALGGGVLRVDLLSVEGVGADDEDAFDGVRRREGDEPESAAPLKSKLLDRFEFCLLTQKNGADKCQEP